MYNEAFEIIEAIVIYLVGAGMAWIALRLTAQVARELGDLFVLGFRALRTLVDQPNEDKLLQKIEQELGVSPEVASKLALTVIDAAISAIQQREEAQPQGG